MGEKNKEKIFLIFEKIRKDKKSLMIVSLGLIGMLLISLSELVPQKEIDKEEISPAYYSERSEHTVRLEEIIGKIKGVGKVKVMLMYEGTAENVYANNISEQKTDKENRKEEEHIILDKGDTEDGLLIKSVYPRVTGVAVVCEGGESSSVKNEITNLLKALFSISSNNISISEMED